jgi:hypothetical protein
LAAVIIAAIIVAAGATHVAISSTICCPRLARARLSVTERRFNDPDGKALRSPSPVLPSNDDRILANIVGHAPEDAPGHAPVHELGLAAANIPNAPHDAHRAPHRSGGARQR